MPHKRNPIACEQIVGLARLIRGNAHAALENVALWHERDISHSSVERVILPDSFIALDHMLRRFTKVVRGMRVDAGRMRENLEAYEWVQRNAMRAFDERADFKALLLADPDVANVLSHADIERAFDLGEQFRHVDAVFSRVFEGRAQVESASRALHPQQALR